MTIDKIQMAITWAAIAFILFMTIAEHSGV